MAVKHYRELIAWQKGMDLVEAVYRATRMFPREEVYGLTAQLRRAAVSVPSNIAEGQGRSGTAEFVRYLRMAYGSLQELETQVLLAQRLGYLDASEVSVLLAIADELGRVINGLRRSLEDREPDHGT